MEKIKNSILSYNFDKFYKELGEDLNKTQTEEELIEKRREARKHLAEELQLYTIEVEKEPFTNLLMQENADAYLWILNSKYIDDRYQKNYLDAMSPIFEKSNQVIRKGINIYKSNG